ncbi:MAG: hypothetical protein KDJ29_21480, partial [Hyphomicrobiales bacterium]|nr:hypothetical protein [Hyphomicrobiales bacterium]
HKAHEVQLLAVAPQPKSPADSPFSDDNRSTNSSTKRGKTIVGPVDIAPEGWRKTTRGWERAEDWPTSIAASNSIRINDSLRFQQQTEESTAGARFLDSCLRVVRGINPITLVGIQLGLLVILFVSVTRREAKALSMTTTEGFTP